MYLLLIGTERCCDVAAAAGVVGVWLCDGCVGDTGDTTNACTMYRVMGVWLWVSVWPAACTCCRSIDVF